jgi:hypothetical protein
MRLSGGTCVLNDGLDARRTSAEADQIDAKSIASGQRQDAGRAG